MYIHTHSRYPCRSVICESLSFFIFLFERYLYAIMSANSRQYILEMNIFFNKLPLLYRIHLCYTVREMNDMQNRIICVKCSANGELSPKRKVRLTVYDPHPLQQYKRISHIVLGNVFDIHSITIGDILFNLVKRIISISKIQRRLFFNG